MDVFGITYIIETAQQFWSELEELLLVPSDATLQQLDMILRRFTSFCATYHEQYLQTPVQLQHACDLLLASELFAFHSERMSDILLKDAEATTDPHIQLIIFRTLISFGRSNANFLRAQKKWQPLLPVLMEHIRLEYDPEVEEHWGGSVSSSGYTKAWVVPIESRLRLLAVSLLYEVCRVQKLSAADLRIFDDAFVDHLFELVEQTRHMQDETLNYSVIKLIAALNEQFMVASLQPHDVHAPHPHKKPSHPEDSNRVLLVLMRRLNFSKTFGENMIFMLNRADRTAEDLCMQLLVLKILYLLFTTKGTTEYFYTNDLCVLVDVFLRELLDIDEDNESLRHTYLRVLHPLLTRTQLRTYPYKRAQIVRTLESLISHTGFREVSPTTRRLVERCLAGEWCVPFRRVDNLKNGHDHLSPPDRGGSPGSASATSDFTPMPSPPPSSNDTRPSKPQRERSLRSTKSVEHLKAPASGGGNSKHHRPRLPQLADQGKPSNSSALSLASVAGALPAVAPVPRRRQTSDTDPLPSPTSIISVSSSSGASISSVSSVSTLSTASTTIVQDALAKGWQTSQLSPPIASPLGVGPQSLSEPHLSRHAQSASAPSSAVSSKKPPAHHRSAPAPPKRRKPPAVPVGRTAAGATITAIASSSNSSPLSRVPPSYPA